MTFLAGVVKPESHHRSSHGSYSVCACMHKCLVAQLCPALCNPMGPSLPGFSIHGNPRQEYWSGLPFSTPSVCKYRHKMTNSVFLLHNQSKTWIVLQLWCSFATKGSITYPHAHSPEWLHKNKCSCLAVNIGRLVNLGCIPQWLINSNNCTTISSAISSIHLVMVLNEEEYMPRFELQPLLKVHDKCP